MKKWIEHQGSCYNLDKCKKIEFNDAVMRIQLYFVDDPHPVWLSFDNRDEYIEVVDPLVVELMY